MRLRGAVLAAALALLTPSGRTGLTRKTDFGFVCRLPSKRNTTAPKPELPGIGLPAVPSLP